MPAPSVTPAPAAKPLSPLEELTGLLREAATLSSVSYLLGWDQETYMPPAGAEGRAEQSALVSALVHERQTSKRVGELIAACEGDKSLTGDAESESAADIREMRRDY